MYNMADVNYVAGLKSNFHATFDTPQGKAVMKYLEMTCCWYKSVWEPGQPDMTLINDGRRQVLSTIKSILELSPEQIVQLAKQKEE